MKKIFLLIALVLVFAASSLQAQVTFPTQTANLAACGDFATNELGDPWDMSNPHDITNFMPGLDLAYIQSPGFSSGLFSANTHPDSYAGSFFTMFASAVCGSYPTSGRWGQLLNLDTTKYKQLSVRMYVDKRDPFGLGMFWDRGCLTSNNRNRTLPGSIKTKVGWHTYSIDLNSVQFDSGSPATNSWSSAPVYGLGMVPAYQPSTQFKIDWIRLEDPAQCNNVPFSSSYTVSASGDNNLLSVYLMPSGVTNPVKNGYARKLATAVSMGSGSLSMGNNTYGIAPGDYTLVGLLDSDFATLELDNPWDFSDRNEIYLTNIPGADISGGQFTGNGAGNLYLDVGNGINANKYRYLTVKGNFTGNVFKVLYNSGGYTTVSGDQVSAGLYQIDLGTKPNWNGTKTDFIIQTVGQASIDFVSLRASGYDSDRSQNSIESNLTAAAGRIRINQSPVVTIDKPDIKGGEAHKNWDMNPGDFGHISNLTSGTDPKYPAEQLTTYLPDVRTVDGIRGDFFKGTSLNGSDDPNHYLLFPFGMPFTTAFNSDEYRNMCFKILIDRPFDIGTGSVARVIWKPTHDSFKTSEDIILIEDGWTGKKWTEHCFDMKKIHIDGTSSSDWTGIIEALRIDPHEFNTSTSYYFDSALIRKDILATSGVLPVVVNVSNPAETSSLNIYLGPNENNLNGATSSLLSVSNPSAAKVYEVPTGSVPNGRYFVHVVANGSSSSVTRHSAGAVQVANGLSQGANPVLNIQAPSNGDSVCNSVQLKGWAIQPDRYEDVYAVEVALAGQPLTVIYPTVYNPAAKASYPNLLSGNAGFDQIVAIPSGSGSQVLSFTAYSSRGLKTTVSKTINRALTGCTEPIADAPPSGSPVAPDLSVPGPQPTAVPPPAAAIAKISKLKHESSGKITVDISSIKAANSNCTLTVIAQGENGLASRQAGRTTINKTDVKKKKIRFSGSKITVSKKVPGSAYMYLIESCAGKADANSPVAKLKLRKGKKGIASAEYVIAKIRLKKTKLK